MCVVARLQRSKSNVASMCIFGGWASQSGGASPLAYSNRVGAHYCFLQAFFTAAAAADDDGDGDGGGGDRVRRSVRRLLTKSYTKHQRRRRRRRRR